MKTAILGAVALIPCLMAVLAGTPSLPVYAASTEAVNPLVMSSAPFDPTMKLPAIVGSIAPIPRETRIRRSIAQATFCLPQNILGTLHYALLRLTGNVVDTAEMNEMTIIVTRTPFGASLGKYIFLGEALLAEYTVRHEYGHTMQGYKRGPFYLLFEGLVSFVQVAFSMISPSFADGYYERWPEDEANRLGGIEKNMP